jgi:hypothetical protein
MTENWYILLGLEFYPNPVQDEAVIKDVIDKKKKEWSSKANDPFKGAVYRQNLEYAKKGIIEKDMIGEDNIRAELIKDACAKTYGPIDDTLKRFHKTEIASDAVTKMAKKLKVDEDIIKRRISAMGMKIVAPTEDYQAVYDKYYKNKPQNADTYITMASQLDSFNVADLYEFLYKDTNIKNARTQPCSALQQRTQELKKTYSKKADAISGTGKKLCGFCDTAFKDDASKKIYDSFLEYQKRHKVLEDVKSIYDISGDFTIENQEDAIGKLTEIFKNRQNAEKVLLAYCKIEKIPYVVNNKTEESTKNIKICRCGAINDISDGRKNCKVCGLPLQIKCPKCGTLNDNNVNVCKCGFDFSNLDKAVSLCELADHAIDHLEFEVADMHLSDAERYWPGYEKAVSLRGRLDDMKKRIGSAAQGMNDSFNAKNYYEAKKQYEGVRKLFPEYKDEDFDNEVNKAISEAEMHKKKAEAAKDENTIISECTLAFEACRDYPGIKEIISKYPPQPPTNLQVSVDTQSQVNVLSWTASATKGLLYYNIIRKEGAVPISVQDGVSVGRVSMCTVTDRNISAGKPYYYAIFAERAEIYSKALTTKDAIENYFEISGLTVAAGDTSLQFDWNPISENADVVAEREADGTHTKLEINGRSSFIDKELKNDHSYKYVFHLEYQVGTKTVSTKGVAISGTPTRPPLPVEKLTVRPKENGEFTISWKKPDENPVQFFYSKDKPKYFFGDIVPLSKLQSTMTELMIKKSSEEEGVFHYDGEDTIYIAAFVVKSGSAIMGDTSRVSKGGSVKIENVNVVNGKIRIATNLPPKCTGFVVLYKFDKFASDISDQTAVRKHIPLKQYQYDSCIFIDSCESRDYYFSVFAEFRSGGDVDYSAGTDYLFSNIGKQIVNYSVAVNKGILGGHIIVTFEGDNKNMKLPAIDIMSSIGVAPMFKQSAKLMYQIPAQDIKGSLRIEIPLKGIPKNTYIKAFLSDESQQSKYQLKLKLKSDLKIS